MHSKVESLLAMTCVVVALGLAASDTQRCDGDERPHPRGLCGRRLAQAHSNLCFLLREVYHREHYHPTKRSPRFDPSTKGLVEKIYRIPLNVLADLDLTKDDWHMLLAKKSLDSSSNNFRSAASDSLLSDDLAMHESQARFQQRGANAFTKRIARLLMEQAKAPSTASQEIAAVAEFPSRTRAKRTVLSSNMVCDCCYNRCSPEELGTYC